MVIGQQGLITAQIKYEQSVQVIKLPKMLLTQM